MSRTYFIGKTFHFNVERTCISVKPKNDIPFNVFRDLAHLAGRLLATQDAMVFEFVIEPAPHTIERAEEILKGALFKKA